MMKILLVQPPMILKRDEILQFSPPLGLAYIAAALRERGHDVQIIDSIVLRPRGLVEGNHVRLGVDWATIRDKIADYGPNIVGVSSMFASQAECTHRVAELAKTVDGSITTMVGGAHASALPEETLKDRNVDFVVIGEGERTTLDLVDSLSNRRSLLEIDGVGYREGDRTIIRPKSSFIEFLDELPMPAWDLLEMKGYAKLSVGHSPLVKDKPVFSVVTSRGCPGNCIFCAIHKVFGHRWRARSPKNVVDEIQVLRERFGINQIDFEDDNLLLDKKRMEAICDEIVDRRLSISWATPNGVHVNRLDRALLTKMRRSGCFSLSFGIESGNENVRDNVIGKPISIEHARNVVGWCRSLNIWTNGFFVVGLPGEDEGTAQETIDLAQHLDLDSSSFFVAAPFPGTRLLQLCQEKGYLAEEYSFSKLKISDATIATESFTPEKVLAWRRRAYREFGAYFLKREFLHLHILRRLLRIRSWSDIQLHYRIGIRFVRLMR